MCISPFVALPIHCVLHARTHRPSMEQAKHVVVCWPGLFQSISNADSHSDFTTLLHSSLVLFGCGTWPVHLNSNTDCGCLLIKAVSMAFQWMSLRRTEMFHRRVYDWTFAHVRPPQRFRYIWHSRAARLLEASGVDHQHAGRISLACSGIS